MQASLQEVLARFTGHSNELLSYEEVAKKLKLNVRSERGVHEIPLKAIVGSVGRYTDFTRSFLPRSTTNQERWARVKAVIDDPSGTGWPPIDVYKVGEVYFVLDGNHRVSVARQEGFEFIEAHVIEVKTDIPLTPDTSPDDLIIKAEYAEFLEQTDLNHLRPGVDLSVSIPGQYQKLLEHIQVHQYFMGLDFGREFTYQEAVEHWYDSVYLPMVEPIRERGLLRWFPGRTETDLYLWVSEHRATLEKELGWAIRPEAAVTDLALKSNPQVESDVNETGSWRLSKMIDRYADRLFREILVPVNGTDEGWQALEQAILVAQKEGSELHGLTVVPARGGTESPDLQEYFSRRCAEVGLNGSLAIDKGEVAARVCERALLTDLIVLNVAHPPSPGLAGWSSGLRSIIWKSARPILTVPGRTSPMDRAIVAFDGSPKSKEALFVAAYLSERWHTHLTVLTVSTGSLTADVQSYAREYLELHEIQADFRFENGTLEKILDVIHEQEANLVIMGGYSGSIWEEMILGSAVNLLLRDAQCPLLICR